MQIKKYDIIEVNYATGEIGEIHEFGLQGYQLVAVVAPSLNNMKVWKAIMQREIIVDPEQ